MGLLLTFVSAPDKEGVFAPVVLGLDSLRYYLGRQPKLGATGARIACHFFVAGNNNFAVD